MPFFRPFALERYFARHEFSARHLLCTSDCETLSLGELLAMEPGAGERLQALRLGYTESRGAPELRAELARRYGGALGPEGVIVFAGAQEAILDLCLALLSAGDEVVVSVPCYQSLAELPRALGCVVRPWPLRPAGGRWSLDPDELRGLVGRTTRLVIVNLPHNPTGALLAPEEYAAVVAVCQAAGVPLLVDEVYRGLEWGGARPLPAACEAYEHGLSLGVLSKTAGLAGLRIGWLASRRQDVLEAVAAVKDYASLCAAGPSELLAAVAVRQLDSLLARNRARCERNLTLLRACFARWAEWLNWIEPAGGSVALARLEGPLAAAFGGDAARLAERVLAEAGVLLAPGALFEAEPASFRVGFGREDLPAALAAFEAWLAGTRMAR